MKGNSINQNQTMYSYLHEVDHFVILYDGKERKTPMGTIVITKSEQFAKCLVHEFEENQDIPTDPCNLAAYHYAYLDFFSVLPRKELEHNIVIGLSRDWTLNCPTAEPEPMIKWYSAFGMGFQERELVINWLKDLNMYQLAAVCVMGRFMESVNLAYVLSYYADRKQLKRFSKYVQKCYPYMQPDKMLHCFEKYLQYFEIDKLELAVQK